MDEVLVPEMGDEHRRERDRAWRIPYLPFTSHIGMPAAYKMVHSVHVLSETRRRRRKFPFVVAALSGFVERS
jgi:hypothetical protein